MTKVRDNFKSKIAFCSVLLLVFTLLSCNEPVDFEAPRVLETDTVTVYDTLYLPPVETCSDTIYFNSWGFAVVEGSASYEVEVYRSTCSLEDIELSFTLSGTEGAKMEILFYDGYMLTHIHTAFPTGEQAIKIHLPQGFNSIRFKVDNVGGTEGADISIGYLRIKKGAS